MSYKKTNKKNRPLLSREKSTQAMKIIWWQVVKAYVSCILTLESTGTDPLSEPASSGLSRTYMFFTLSCFTPGDCPLNVIGHLVEKL